MKKGFRKNLKKITSIVLALAMVITVCPQTKLMDINADDTTPYVISKGRPVYTSSGKNAEDMVDGNLTTRWESAYGPGISDTQWMYVDLGKETLIDHMYIKWEAAYASAFKVQVSNDEENWTDAYTVGDSSESEDETTGQVGLNITYKNSIGIKNPQGEPITAIQANWTSVNNAVYKVCVDTEDNVAVAPDGYKFTNHGDANGLIALAEGTYKLIVIALNKTTKQEIGRGERNVVVSEIETTTQAEVVETTTASDPTQTNIDFTKLSDDVKTARYVRIYMTKKAMPAYGYSIFEVQVYGNDGVVKRPADYGTNIAQGKTVTSSGLRDEWWMYDDEGNIMPNQLESVKAENAVDGNENTSFTSYQADSQWICVDLGQAYDIGRISVKWTGDAGKVYDYQVSEDGENFTTVYRNKLGHGNFTDNQPIFAENVRYVRIYDYTRVENGSGIGIYELCVYEYQDGEEKVTNEIDPLDEARLVNSTSGKGSYLTNSMYVEQTKIPTYIDEKTVKAPIASNDWWQSSIIKQYGNTMCLLPLKAKYSKAGLEILTAQNEWLPTNLTDTSVNFSTNSETQTDFSILPENFDTATGCDSVSGYGDYSVTTDLCDENGKQMTGTFVKGSPYIFTEFQANTVAYISSSNITSIFDDNGNNILTDSTKTQYDHIGVEITDNDNASGEKNSKSYYCFTVPEGTVFQNRGSKIKVVFPSATENYMSIGSMNDKASLDSFYRHGYAFVTNTEVTYTYNDNSQVVNTKYIATTNLRRAGFENSTMQLMLPHQWKYSDASDLATATYTSPRGILKGVWNNEFSTKQTFAGLLPTFATPTNADFDVEKCEEYLNTLVAATASITPAADAYWEGKNVHPLAMGALMADQLGDIKLRDTFLKRLRERLVDWFTYDGKDDVSYFLYNEKWGTIYYSQSEFGANAAICDHHFTYGYFMFGATVLATYDNEFYTDYKDMIEMLVRDYANPSGDDDMFCKFRAFDQYEGHSWAGGYADNDSGNNQESASESLFSWEAIYLWGILTGDDKYIDAGAYGFTTEMESVEQYWFDYDKDNWIADWPYECVAQVYGANNFYGTFFGGQPLYCYGIQWLPVSEYLTYYGMNQERCAEIYQGLLDDTEKSMNIAAIVARQEGKTEEEITALLNGYAHPDTGWQHITWPFLSQTNPTLAMEKFLANDSKIQNTDQANTYWFISSMGNLGYKVDDILATGDISSAVYYNDTTKKYTAQCWNPTTAAKTATFVNDEGTVLGTATIQPAAFANIDIDTENNFDIVQEKAPSFVATDVASGKKTSVTTGSVSFDDTQLVEIVSEDSEATIYYTTDGTAPDKNSKVYTDAILVSSDATIKAVATRDGFIDSSYGAIAVTINGDTVQSKTNVALNSKVTISSETGNKGTNAVDGDEGSRWESNSTDDQWIKLDLGTEKTINTVKVKWEAAYAKSYEIQVSLDGEEWTKVTTQVGSVGYVETIFEAVPARFVKIQGLSRGTVYGYSIFEIQVFEANTASKPNISVGDGIYSSAQNVVLSTTVKGAEIKYTTDGTIPTVDSKTYSKPITISNSTLIRAITYRRGMKLSEETSSNIVIGNTISIIASKSEVAVGNTLKLSAVADGLPTWKSENTSIATINSDGIVSGVSTGEAIIKATLNGVEASYKVTVVKAIHLTDIVLDSTSKALRVKDTYSFKTTFLPANTTDNLDVIWTSDDDSIATVDENGCVTARNIGETYINVTSNGITSSCKIIVEDIPISEKVASPQFNLALNKQVTISSIYAGEGSQTTDILTDGKLDGTVLSTDWDATRTEEKILIDLGRRYYTDTIDKVVIQYKNADVFCGNYYIELSADGILYKTIKTVSNLTYDNTDSGLVVDTLSADKDMLESARYVRITLDGHKAWGYQLREVAVLLKDDATVGDEPDMPYVDEMVTSSDLSIDGFQMSSTFKGVDGSMGFRTVYASKDVVLDKNVVETGIIIGLNYNGVELTDKDLYVGSKNNYVASFAATSKGVIETKNGSTRYARTFDVNNFNKTGYDVKYFTRVYVKLENGSYVYSDVAEYSIFRVAKYVYNNAMMSTYKGHNYVYNKILKISDPDFKEVDYQWAGTLVK